MGIPFGPNTGLDRMRKIVNDVTQVEAGTSHQPVELPRGVTQLPTVDLV